MRPHWIQSHFPPQLPSIPSGEELEFNALTSVDTMFTACWLIKIWNLSIAINYAAVDFNYSNAVSDGENIGVISPTVGYDNELEKILPRRTGITDSFSTASFTSYWGDWGVERYVAGSPFDWPLHIRVSFQPNDEQPLLWNYDDGTRVLQDGATFNFCGEDFPMYSSFGSSIDFSGGISIGPASGASSFWPYKRADGTNPVRSASNGVQLISNAAELNIR